jgi:hypothetical protein
MRGNWKALAMAAALALLGRTSIPAAPPADVAWEKLKTLVGTWEGKAEGHPATVSYKLVSGGTAVAESLTTADGADMVTIYTRDGSRLLMTHYCSENNQPRMRSAGLSPDGREISFTFLDVTNLPKPDASHMSGLVLIFPDADHLTQRWTHQEAPGKAHTSDFEFTRKR